MFYSIYINSLCTRTHIFIQRHSSTHKHTYLCKHTHIDTSTHISILRLIIMYRKKIQFSLLNYHHFSGWLPKLPKPLKK